MSGDTTLRELNPFRYRGYIYDSESGLYYLQSRYYDPFTGRFINADVYCDTATGSPLSTNMFAYCENNAIFASDPTGYWASNNHKTMTNNAGFSGNNYKTVRDWVYKADSYPCKSTNEYSTPFHGRNNALDIGKYLYKLALDVKKRQKKYKFSFTAGNGYYKLSNTLKYQNKKNKTSTANAESSFISNLNKAKDYKTQYSILLGLSLHTLQDYFAHVIPVTVKKTTTEYRYGRKYVSINYSDKKIFEADDMMGVSNSVIEDNTSVFSWRYYNAKCLTKSIYKRWIKNSGIDTLKFKKGKNKQTITRYTSGAYTPTRSVQYKWEITAYRYDYFF